MRDIVVVGASAGGMDAIADMLAQLPADLPAAVFVVAHVPPTSRADYVRVFARATSLPVRLARDGDTIYRGNVYVARPDHHLVLGPEHMCVARGPKENTVRPAIDPLFRSAAMTYGSRVIGVLLSGYLDDGVAGLAAVAHSGGVTIVQDPADAVVPDLPRAGLARVSVTHRVPVYRMGATLVRAVRSDEGNSTGNLAPMFVIETAIAAGGDVPMRLQEDLGPPAGLGCPECGGPLHVVADPDVRRYRCHIGHAYTTAALLSDQSEQVERALSAALRTLEERGRLLADMAATDRALGRDAEAQKHDAQADTARHHAATLREIVLHSGGSEGDDLDPAATSDTASAA